MGIWNLGLNAADLVPCRFGPTLNKAVCRIRHHRQWTGRFSRTFNGVWNPNECELSKTDSHRVEGVKFLVDSIPSPADDAIGFRAVFDSGSDVPFDPRFMGDQVFHRPRNSCE